MKADLKRIQKSRVFSDEFKRKIVSEFERGRFSVSQLSRLHTVSDKSIYNWIYKYSTVSERGVRVVEKSRSSMQKMKEMEKKIAELERALGQKQVKLDYYEKMVELAEEELGIDLKKNSSTLRSGGSGSTAVK